MELNLYIKTGENKMPNKMPNEEVNRRLNLLQYNMNQQNKQPMIGPQMMIGPQPKRNNYNVNKQHNTRYAKANAQFQRQKAEINRKEAKENLDRKKQALLNAKKKECEQCDI